MNELITIAQMNEAEISQYLIDMSKAELIAFCKRNQIKPGRRQDHIGAAYRFCLNIAAQWNMVRF